MTYEQYKYDLIGNLEENFVAEVKGQIFINKNFPLEIFLLKRMTYEQYN